MICAAKKWLIDKYIKIEDLIIILHLQQAYPDKKKLL